MITIFHKSQLKFVVKTFTFLFIILYFTVSNIITFLPTDSSAVYRADTASPDVGTHTRCVNTAHLSSTGYCSAFPI